MMNQRLRALLDTYRATAFLAQALRRSPEGAAKRLQLDLDLAAFLR